MFLGSALSLQQLTVSAACLARFSLSFRAARAGDSPTAAVACCLARAAAAAARASAVAAPRAVSPRIWDTNDSLR